MITLGEDGMAVFNSAQKAHIIPTRARTVHDVSGAGDTVISMITLSLSSGANFEEAATLANFAAGIVCGEVGIVPIKPEQLLDGIFYSS
jgi:bifunctional ADP-heptose synthase (sugar kinase/adenylyltransferase)